jgi:LysM repeat protein
MFEITHHKARALLQVAADRSLAPADRSALDAHLAACQECRYYADRLASLEVSLSIALRARWDSYRPELNLQAIKHPSRAKLAWNHLFSQRHAFGKVTVMAALLLGYILIVNLAGIRVPIADNETPTVLPTPNGYTTAAATSPTPSIQAALTELTSQACETLLYIVQKDDTLERIAVQHEITKEAILEYNPDADFLASNTVFTGMQLFIPQCQSTPSRTAGLPGSLLTTTPINGTIFPVQTE